MSFTWTTEQIMGLSPDNYAVKIGRNLALAEKWLFTHTDAKQETIWAEYRNTGAKIIRVTITPQTLDYTCSCGSRKAPCNHVLALLLLWAEQPSIFDAAPLPAWVQTWRDQRQPPQSPSTPQITSSATDRADSDERRLHNTLSGLRELQLWLQDMVRGGFGALETKPKNYWESMSNRLVDAQAGALGRELKTIGNFVTLAAAGKTPKAVVHEKQLVNEWPQKLLSKLGRIHLLIQGFEQFNTLPRQTQTDLREAVGWLNRISPDDAHSETVCDHWLVMGKVVTDEGRHKMQRTWLWGRQTNRPAQIIHLLYKPQSIDLNLIVGAEVEAELIFAPSSTRLRAELLTRRQTGQASQFVSGYDAIAAAVAAYARTVTANPWLTHFPVALSSVSIYQQRQKWFLQDAAGDLLPLPPGFEHGWHLSALGHAAPIALFGEWNGEYFTPLTVWQNGRLIELAVLKGVK